MRKSVVFALVASLSTSTGCSIYDFAFGLFGDHYSAGGTSEAEKRLHYDREDERWQSYDPDLATK